MKRDKIRKQTKLDYIYKCDRCHVTAHEPEPSNIPCPICQTRMTFVSLISWPKPNPVTYSRETTQDNINKPEDTND